MIKVKLIIIWHTIIFDILVMFILSVHWFFDFGENIPLSDNIS